MAPQTLSGVVTLPGGILLPVLLLVKVTVILAAAFGLNVVMQRASAGTRHLVWLVALGSLLLVPALGAWAPLRLAVLPAAAPRAAIGEPSDVSPASAGAPRATPASANAPAGAASMTAPAASGANVAVGGGPPMVVEPRNPSVADRTSFSQSLRTRLGAASPVALLFSLWAAVVLAIAAWLAWGALAVRRIVRGARPLASADWTTPLYEIADRLELEQAPRLVRSAEARMPFACGFLHATIVLPDDCERWTLDRRRAVLLHELAHVKRRDLIGHTLGRLACALWWFHPLAWTAARRLRAESERACDDMAIASGARASDYAEHLLEIVTSVRVDRTPAVALAMARRKEFEGRMLAILDDDAPRVGPGRRQSLALVATLGMIALVVGAAAPAPRASARQAATRAAADSLRADGSLAPPSSAVLRAERRDAEEPGRAPAVLPGRASRAAAAVHGDSEPDAIQREAGRFAGRFAGRGAGTTSTGVIDALARIAQGATGGASQAQQAGEKQRIRERLRETHAAAAPDDDRPVLLAKVLATDSSARLRRIAAWGLAEYAEGDVAQRALAGAVRRDASADVREMAAWALGGSDEAPVVVEALGAAVTGDADAQVRATAAWALGSIGDESGSPALTKALGDSSRRVRTLAAWALGNVEEREAPKPLLAMLRDDDRGVRELAAWALFRIEDTSTVPALQEALRAEKDPKVRTAFIRALGAMGEASVDALRDMLESSDPEVKAMAVRALARGSIGQPWPWPWPQPRPFP